MNEAVLIVNFERYDKQFNASASAGAVLAHAKQRFIPKTVQNSDSAHTENKKRAAGEAAGAVLRAEGDGRGERPPLPPEAQQQRNAASALDKARAAIAQGANRKAVIKRLRESGINPEGL
jgi:hypothetical protein